MNINLNKYIKKSSRLISSLLIILIIFFSKMAQASDLTIINVKRNIQLSETEPAYRDYYLSSGESSGLKKNMVVTVERKSQIKDSSGANSFGDVNVPIAQIKILAVYKSTAVAREFKALSRKDHPVVEQIGIQVGDTINLKDSFIDRTPAANSIESAN